MSRADLDALEAAARAATPGPWEATRQTDDECSFIGYFIEAADRTISDDGTAPGHADALFIAEANPAVVLDLIQRLRVAEAAHAAQSPVQGEPVVSDSAYLQELISLWENGDVGVVDFQERLYAIDAARKAAKP